MQFNLRRALLLATAAAGVANAATLEQWRSRSIYQVLTDRFARSDVSTTAKCDTKAGDYCGGTYRGIMKKLDYIQDMGFSAVWISPITYNLPEKTKFGYAWHGYWQQDLYRLNEHYGTARDLKALSSALHNRGMYLMVDVVTNHNGWNGSAASVDYSCFHPFNDRKYYHDYCPITNYSDQDMVENCWLGDVTVPLPDLKTEDSIVSDMYNTWIAELVSNYSIDGLRLDTAKHVDKTFWSSFQNAAGVFATGEVLSSEAEFACDYQNHIDSVLNYPAYYAIIDFLNSTSGSTASLLRATQTFKSSCNDLSVLGTFTENHDLPRFASQTKDMALAKNALALTLLWDGIPIVYAGQEHHYSGYADPANREATWLSGYKRDSELYTLTRAVNRVRNRAIALDHKYTTYNIWPIHNDTNTIAFRKGFNGSQIVSVFTNTGSGTSSWTLNLDCEAAGWTPGTEVIEVISCTKHVIHKDGYLPIQMQGGLPKVYFSTAAVNAGSGICNTYWGQNADSGEDLSPSSTSKGYAAPSDTKRSAASAGVKGINGVKKKAAAVAGVLAYEVLNG